MTPGNATTGDIPFLTSAPGHGDFGADFEGIDAACPVPIEDPAAAIAAGHVPEESMTTDPENDTQTYVVVINAEEQYSIWPAERAIPAGWTAVGAPRPKADCLKYIEEVWTDMRPLSLRKRMEEEALRRAR
jgi:MbtH protein